MTTSVLLQQQEVEMGRMFDSTKAVLETLSFTVVIGDTATNAVRINKLKQIKGIAVLGSSMVQASGFFQCGISPFVLTGYAGVNTSGVVSRTGITNNDVTLTYTQAPEVSGVAYVQLLAFGQ